MNNGPCIKYIGVDQNVEFEIKCNAIHFQCDDLLLNIMDGRIFLMKRVSQFVKISKPAGTHSPPHPSSSVARRQSLSSLIDLGNTLSISLLLCK